MLECSLAFARRQCLLLGRANDKAGQIMILLDLAYPVNIGQRILRGMSIWTCLKDSRMCMIHFDRYGW